MNDNWILYGAYGFTGRLIAEEAIKRGHKPLLAGRSAGQLIPLGESLGLPTHVVSLRKAAALGAAIQNAPLVLNAAGPYSQTAAPVQAACIEKGSHYLDITGEIPVFEQTFAQHRKALDAGISLISGVGFDVIPSDCLALYVAQQLPEAALLETGIAALGKASAGTTKSSLEILAGGSLIRQNGKLKRIPMGTGERRLPFSDRERSVLAFPWGDLSTAYRSTGIANITSYLALSRQMIKWLKRAGGILPSILSITLVRKLLQAGVGKTVQGPGLHLRDTARSQLWAQVTSPAGHTAAAWLETGEAYQFTALAAVRSVEKILAGNVPTGALAPATAFGPDFVLEIPSTRRFDHLPPTP